jgi:hypothetical protein
MATFETLSVVHASWGYLPRLCPSCEGRAHGGVHLINLTTFHFIIDIKDDKKNTCRVTECHYQMLFLKILLDIFNFREIS